MVTWLLCYGITGLGGGGLGGSLGDGGGTDGGGGSFGGDAGGEGGELGGGGGGMSGGGGEDGGGGDKILLRMFSKDDANVVAAGATRNTATSKPPTAANVMTAQIMPAVPLTVLVGRLLPVAAVLRYL